MKRRFGFGAALIAACCAHGPAALATSTMPIELEIRQISMCLGRLEPDISI